MKHIYTTTGFQKYTTLYLLIFVLGNCISTIDLQAQLCPKPSFTTSSIKCAGQTLTLANTSQNTNDGSTYKWDFNDGSATTSGNTASHSFASQGTYNIKLLRTCPNGNKDSSIVPVTINPKPTPNAFSVTGNGQCSENALGFTTNSPTQGSTYTWEFGDALSKSDTASGINSSHIFEAYGVATQNYTVTLTTQDNKGCFATTTQQVTVKQRPDLQVSEANGFKTCILNAADGVNADVILFNETQDPSKTSISSYSINWDDGSAIEKFTNSAFDNITGISHQYIALNRYKILVTASGGNGCNTKSEYVYIMDSKPSVNLGEPPIAGGCGPITLDFQNNSKDVSSTTKLYFDPGDGSEKILLPSGITGNTISHTYKTSCNNGTLKSYSAILTAENECYTPFSSYGPIVVYPKPIAQFSVGTVCKGVPATFTNNSIPNRCASNSATRYTWDWGDGSAPLVSGLINASLSPQQSITHTYPDTGTYIVKLKADNTSNNGCGSTEFIDTIIVSAPPKANFTTNPKSGCTSLPVKLTNTSEGINLSYNWSILPNSGFTYTNSTTPSSTNPEISFNQPGQFIVTLTTTTPCGTSQKKDTIVVKSKPTVTFPATSPPAQCAPASFLQTVYMPTINANGGTITKYAWDFGSGIANNTHTANPGNVTFNTPGKYDVSLLVTNECGTAGDTATTFFNIGTPPIAFAGRDTAICAGNTVNIGGTSIPNHVYSWAPNTGMSSNSVSNPSVTLSNTGASPTVNLYILTVTANGCSSKDSVLITANPFPTVTAGKDTSICKSESSLLLLGASPSGGTWSGGAFINSSGLFDAKGLTAGTYTVKYTYNDNTTNCSASNDKIITINPLPAVDAGANKAFCNTSVTETLSGYSPTGGTWAGLGVTASGDFTPSDVGIMIGHKLIYTFIDANNCLSQDSVLIDITSSQPVVMDQDDSICLNNPSFTLASPSPSGGSWLAQPFLNAAGLFDPKISGPGTFVVTYTSGGTSSCQTSGTKNVVVKDTLIINAGPDEVACSNQGTFTLSNQSPNNGTWSSIPSVFLTGSDFDPTKAGTITNDVVVVLKYAITDASTSCTSVDTKTITIKPVPNIDLTAIPTQFCNKDTLLDLGATPNGGVWLGQGIVLGKFNPNTAGVGTHLLKYTATSGTCIDIDSLSVDIAPLIKPNAGPDFDICVDANAKTLTGFTPTGGIWAGNGLNGSTFNPSMAGAGTFELVYATGIGTCKAFDTLSAIVNPIPTLQVGSNPQGVCEKSAAFDLTGWSPRTNGTVVWSGTGITNATLGTFDPLVSGPGSFPLTFTFTDTLTGCDDVKTKILVVNELPVLNFMNPDTVCVSKNLSIANSSTGTGLSYHWALKPNTGFVFTSSTNDNAANPILSFSNSGNYQMMLMGQTGAGCSDSLKKNIVVIDPPKVSFSKDKDEGCGPLSVTFTNTTTGVAKKYLWDFGNGITSVAASPGTVEFMPSRTQDTTYYISLRVTSLSCDDIIIKDSVVVFSKPYVGFGTDKNVVCSKQGIKFINNTKGHPETFVWDFGDGSASNNTQADTLSHPYYYLGNKDTTYVVTLIATNACGSDTSATIVKVLRNTVKAFFNTDLFEGCVPLTVNFSNFSLGGNNYSWHLGDGNVSNNFDIKHTYTKPGVYQVSLAVNNGCSFDTTKPAVKITVKPSPIVKFKASKILACEGQQIVFEDRSSEALIKYKWNFGDGDSSNLANPSHVYDTSNIYKITLEGISAATGCSSKDSAEVDIKLRPVSNFSLDNDTGCQPMLVSIENLSAYAQAYEWSFGNGQTSGDTSDTFAFVFDSAGVFDLKLISYNAIGCKDSSTKTVTIHPKPNSNFSISPAQTCTYPTIVQVINKSTGYSLSNWDFADGHKSTLDAPSNEYLAKGTYPIRLISTSDMACKDTASVTFYGFPMPIPNFEVTPTTGCEPLLVTFANNTQFASQYLWDFGDSSQISKAENPSHIYSKAGSYSVKLIATGNDACIDSTTKPDLITVLVRPNASFSYTNINDPRPHGEIQFTNTTVGGATYLWDFGDTESSSLENPNHRYNTYGNIDVSLIAQNDIGCLDTAIAEIDITPYYGLFVPTAFSPENGSPEVRIFLPKGTGLEKYKLQIYDQWGILIWESTKVSADGKPLEGWDGRSFDGTEMPPDVYVWRVEAAFKENGIRWEGQDLNNEGKVKNVGTVTLIR